VGGLLDGLSFDNTATSAKAELGNKPSGTQEAAMDRYLVLWIKKHAISKIGHANNNNCSFW
jgi:hypothetical protein